MDAEKHAGQNRWRSLRSFDAAKAGLLLYILGMLTSGIYYARFNILALDFARIQSIVLGVYVIGLYFAMPAAAIWLAGRIRVRRILRLLACVGIISGLDVSIGVLLGYNWRGLILVLLVTAALQISLFVDWESLWASVRKHRIEVKIAQLPTSARAAALGLLLCLHFSIFWFPHIPGNFAGGMPVSVQVFTKTANLPGNRFFESKELGTKTQLESYHLHLLYQTDKDVYFVDNLSSDGTVIGYYVMRITRDEIVRMDYNVPVWVPWR